jgi:peptidoglycan/LPS O-acetylase OafA/YrhL
MVLAWRTYMVDHGSSIDRIYNGFDTHSDSLFVGCAVDLFSPTKTFTRYCLKWAAIPCAALILIVHYFDLNPWYETAASVATAWIIIAATQDGWLKTFLSCPVLVYTGKRSCEWYLWHLPILIAGTAYFGPGRWTALALGALSYPVAASSYHFIGLPFLRLKTSYSATSDPTAQTLRSTAAAER